MDSATGASPSVPKTIHRWQAAGLPHPQPLCIDHKTSKKYQSGGQTVVAAATIAA
jgi:hypothetical protein